MQTTCSQADCSPAPPVTPPSSPSLASSQSPTVRRRRLWNPPMRREAPTTSRSKLSASSTAPRLVRRLRPLSSNPAGAQGIRPLSRSRRLGHRSHHNLRPLSKTSCPSDGEADRGRLLRRSLSPSPSSTTPNPHAARRPQYVLQRPLRTQPCDRGSRPVASTILTSTRSRAQARPPTTTVILRIDRKLRALAL